MAKPAMPHGVNEMKDHTKSAMHHYRSLALMLLVSFITMFALMYAMTNRFEDLYVNWNQAYMAALMTAPMGLIEIVVMRSMYKDRKMNSIVVVATVVLLVGAWFGIRQQVAISNTQFLRSMIPHHSSAILMCQRATITDPEISKLCAKIVAGQQGEIDQMNAALRRLSN